jgi:hypothetical protein
LYENCKEDLSEKENAKGSCKELVKHDQVLFHRVSSTSQPHPHVAGKTPLENMQALISTIKLQKIISFGSPKGRC